MEDGDSPNASNQSELLQLACRLQKQKQVIEMGDTTSAMSE
tara:strand:- start:717 stop:839 length:123 start_codon:yes stop_codon:yes gene_type:complete